MAANKASALEWPMPQLYISEVARQVGLRPSAIRYYEQIGLLPPAQRLGKQRRYDTTALYRLAIIQRARQLGFTLDEIRQLFFGFSTVTRASVRWQKLSQRKLEELDNLMDRHKGSPATLEKDDAELLLRNAGSMWQGNISQRLWRPRREISACESSIWCKCPIICIEI